MVMTITSEIRYFYSGRSGHHEIILEQEQRQSIRLQSNSQAQIKPSPGLKYLIPTGEIVWIKMKGIELLKTYYYK